MYFFGQDAIRYALSMGVDPFLGLLTVAELDGGVCDLINRAQRGKCRLLVCALALALDDFLV